MDYNNINKISKEEIKQELLKLYEKRTSLNYDINRLENFIYDIFEEERVLQPYDKQKSFAILQAQEDERHRIAKDLHDSIIQNLVSAMFKGEIVHNYLDVDINKSKLELEILLNVIKDTIKELRNVIFDLMPMSLNDLGLNKSISQLTKDIMKINDITINLEQDIEPDNILSIIKLSVFRIIQEACNNVIKHAKANNINIILRYYENKLTLEVSDDGIGFDCESYIHNTDYKCGLGLNIIKERTYLLSGKLDVKSDKNGTSLLFNIPLDYNGGDK